MKKLSNLLIYICFLPVVVFSQDLHFSDWQRFSNYFNPATTGIASEHLQVGAQYRSQWAQIPNAYQTMGVSIQKQGERINWGGLLHKNGAGEGSLENTGGLVTMALKQPLSKGANFLSLGLGFGFLQKRFNPTALTFDAQFNPETGYDAFLDNQEFFTQTNSTNIDFSIGTTWNALWHKEKNITSQFGFSLAHVHLPNISFLQQASTLPTKMVVHGQFDFPISDKNRMQPYAIFQKQGVHRSTVIGQRMKRKVNEHTYIHSGFGVRLKDALILQAGIEWYNASILLSYDLTNSDLSSAVRGLSTFELSFAMTLNQEKKNKKRDRDKDGIYDHKDKCPTIPGLKQFQGCPTPEEDLDTDGDGILDVKDACPYEAGLKRYLGCPDSDEDGIVDKEDACPELKGSISNQGCPITDKDIDKDGIPDVEDYCVYLPGSKEFHGCPDTDQDGVSDIDDECPYLRGSKTNNGCPSTAKQVKQLSAVVEFQTNQAIIQREYARELDAVIQEVQQIANYQIMIAGHTDTEGNAAYNYQLGQKRATAIRNYLLDGGIPLSHIQLLSYGEAKPIAQNTSSLGRARNRRGEVRVVLD